MAGERVPPGGETWHEPERVVLAEALRPLPREHADALVEWLGARGYTLSRSEPDGQRSPDWYAGYERALMDAATPPEPAREALDVERLSQSWAGHWLEIQRGPRPIRFFHTCGPSCSASLAREYAALSEPREPAP